MTQLVPLISIPGFLWSFLHRLFGSTARATANPLTMLRLSDARKLLDNDYHTIETGYGLSADGLMCVAACTYMPHVAPEMLDWWFGWVRTTPQYKLWHPRDHLTSAWEGPSGSYVGGHHLVEEKIGDSVSKLKISFVQPSSFFGEDWEAQFARTGYGTAICGRTSVWDDGAKSYRKSGHLLHLVKKEADGCRVRSRFWLGDVEDSPVYLGSLVPEETASGLMRHCVEEMSILASILPALYEKETGRRGAKL